MFKSRPLLLALALATLPLAGCLGSEDAPQPSPAGEGAAADASAAGDATGNATGAGRGADTAAEGAPAAPREIPFTLEGSVPAFVAACAFAAVAGQCVETPGEWNSEVVIEESGTGESLALTLTWTASSPLTQELNVYVVSHTEDWSEWVHHAFVSGPSPLTLDLAGPFELPEGMTHEIGVAVPFHGTPGDLPAFAGAAAATEQAFTLEGTLTLAS